MNLTIGIPTYNRAHKIEGTVNALCEQLRQGSLVEHVEILISDNASSDSTGETIDLAMRKNTDIVIRYQRHNANLGISGNILSLYNSAKGDYVWLFADDDVPFPGCVSTILNVVRAGQVSVLVYSFVQPPGSTRRLFDFEEQVLYEPDIAKSIGLIMRDSKLSIYVLKRGKRVVDSLEKTAKAMARAPAYGHWSLIFDVLLAHGTLPMAVISEPLAGCAADYVDCLSWHPIDWQNEADVFDHPLIKEYAPDLFQNRYRWMYRTALMFFWLWRSKALGIAPNVASLWWQAIRRFPVKWRWIVGDRKMTVQAIVLCCWPSRGPIFLTRLAKLLRRR